MCIKGVSYILNLLIDLSLSDTPSRSDPMTYNLRLQSWLFVAFFGMHHFVLLTHFDRIFQSGNWVEHLAVIVCLCWCSLLYQLNKVFQCFKLCDLATHLCMVLIHVLQSFELSSFSILVSMLCQPPVVALSSAIVIQSTMEAFEFERHFVVILSAFEDGYECKLHRNTFCKMLSTKVSKHWKNVPVMTIVEYKRL